MEGRIDHTRVDCVTEGEIEGRRGGEKAMKPYPKAPEPSSFPILHVDVIERIDGDK